LHRCRDYFVPLVWSVLLDDWLVEAPWFMLDVALVLLDVWFAETPLVTLWLPLPTCTPGLMLAPAFTAELAMPTFASTPTFGFTLRLLPLVEGELVLPDEVDGDVLPEVDEPEVVDWLVLVPWFIVEVEPMSVADWFALTPLCTDWLPLPMFTPGLTFAPRFTSVLLTPTFASTPTFGFTLSERLLVEEVEGEAEDELLDEGDADDELLDDGAAVEPGEIEPLEAEPLTLPEDELPVPVALRGPLALLPYVPVLSAPRVLPIAPFSVSPVVAEGEDGVVVVLALELVSLQSIWTGLAECSLAAPVSLSASLPALGFLNESQSGLALSLIERVAELGSLLSLRSPYWAEDCAAFESEAWALLELLAATAGSVTPRAAARAIVLRNWLRIIWFLLLNELERTGKGAACESSTPGMWQPPDRMVAAAGPARSPRGARANAASVRLTHCLQPVLRPSAFP
jgi:hypothetical protein